MEINETNKTKYIDIIPLKKGKRILVYLADLFLNIIITFLLFNLLVAPIGKSVTGFDSLDQKHIQLTSEMYSLFYKNNIVYKSPDLEETDLVSNIDYTYEVYLGYYVNNNGLENEIFYHYFNDIANNYDFYLECINKYNNNKYFELDNKSITGLKLKEDIKSQIDGYFISGGEVSILGREYFSDIKNSIYLPIYSEVMTLINNNDLTHKDVEHSYLYCKSEIANLEKYHEILLTICSITSYLFSVSIYYFFIPALTGNKRTLAMLFMHVERVEYKTLGLIKTSHYCFSALFNFLLNACFIMFVPITLIPFNILFKYSVNLYISLISLSFNLISLLFVLINKHNRTWNDCLNSIVYISSDSLDEIYKSKGYKI